ncbi:MAG: class I SAM-dependent methyltransferase [Burkholderiaceae bacterium]
MKDANRDASCVVCQGQLHQGWNARDAKDSSPLPMSFCVACGLVQRAAIPSAEQLAAYYATEYRQDYKKALQPKPKRIYRAGRIATGRLDVLNRFVNHGDLLDIGAGGGEFVFLAGMAGFTARGVEPNEAYGQFARQNYEIDITTAGIDILDGEPCADIVSMFHVLEHLQDPLDAVERIHQALRPGGIAFIEVPNVDAKDAAPDNVYFAAHLLYFSASTLKQLFHRHFECLHLNDQGNLLAVFRRREQVLPPTDTATIGPIDNPARLGQLQSRSWLQYLANGGALKPLRKLTQTVRELSQTNGQQPRDVLLKLHQQRPSG